MFAKAREKARSSSCQSNLKQIGVAVMQYMQDNDETMFATAGGWGNWAQITWSMVIIPYIKSMQVFQCPSNQSLTTSTDNRGVYKINGHIEDTAGGGPPVNPNPYVLSDWVAPAEWILVGESTRANRWEAMCRSDFGWNGCGTTWAGHMAMTNFLFLDGHVKTMKPTKTVTPASLWGAFNDSAGYGTMDSLTRLNSQATSTNARNQMVAVEAAYR